MRAEWSFWSGLWKEVSESVQEVKPRKGIVFNLTRSVIWIVIFLLWFVLGTPYKILRRLKKLKESRG